MQDNSLLVTDAARGPLIVGADVTIGHNVRMGAATIGDHALIGMGSQLGDGVVVEEGGVVGARAEVAPGSVIKAGWIWVGRPAFPFRPIKRGGGRSVRPRRRRSTCATAPPIDQGSRRAGSGLGAI